MRSNLITKILNFPVLILALLLVGCGGESSVNGGVDNKPGIHIAHDGERWNSQYSSVSDDVAEMNDNGAWGDLELTWDRAVGTTWFDKDPDRPAMAPVHIVFDIT